MTDFLSTAWELLGPFLSIVVAGVVVFLFLMLPGIIAIRRKHKNATAILVCGLLFWPVGLIWSLTNNVEPANSTKENSHVNR